jgi:hypothetical protein
VEAHVRSCAACREELERLRITEAALFSLRDEEIPQRIGFVSDKIFEPSPGRRWLAAFWGSTARLGFASAAVLSVAITFSAWHRTPAPVTGTSATAARTAVADSLTPEQIDQRIQKAVAKAVADVEARYAEQNRVQLAAFQKASEDERNRLLLAVGAAYETAQRRAQVIHTAVMARPGDEAGDPK